MNHYSKPSHTAALILAALMFAAVSAAPASATAAAIAAPPANFALIINGDDSFTHNKNVELALETLPKLGYAAADTYVLAPAGSAAAGSWHDEAGEGALRQALAEIGRRMQPGSNLLVYTTGHGYRVFGRPTLALAHGGSISDADLVRRLAALPFGKLILIADQCFSGGLAKAALALGRNVVAVAATDDRHEVRCEPFVRPFWMAALGPQGDSTVAVEEAFRVAADGVRRAAVDPESAPQIGSTGDCSGHDNPFAPTAAATRAAGNVLPATAAAAAAAKR